MNVHNQIILLCFAPNNLLYYQQILSKHITIKMDPCSYSYCDVFSTNHVDIDWTIDFNETKLVGKINMHFEVLKNDAKELVSFC